jgi:hypothetical protein
MKRRKMKSKGENQEAPLREPILPGFPPHPSEWKAEHLLALFTVGVRVHNSATIFMFLRHEEVYLEVWGASERNLTCFCEVNGNTHGELGRIAFGLPQTVIKKAVEKVQGRPALRKETITIKSNGAFKQLSVQILWVPGLLRES